MVAMHRNSAPGRALPQDYYRQPRGQRPLKPAVVELAKAPLQPGIKPSKQGAVQSQTKAEAAFPRAGWGFADAARKFADFLRGRKRIQEKQLPHQPRDAAVLRRLSYFSVAEADAPTRIGSRWRTHQAGSQLALQGDLSCAPMIITSGWACRVHRIHNRTHMVALLLPGDAIAFEDYPDNAITSVWALTSLETIDAQKWVDLGISQSDQRTSITRAVRGLTNCATRHLLSHAARMTEMSRERRLGSLLLEIHGRLSLAGLVAENAFEMPLSVADLSATLALERKDVRRAASRLKRQKLLVWKNGRMKMPDPAKLAERIEYAPLDFTQ